MRLAALVSGGKDSLLALHCAAESHDVACLVNMRSVNPDSYLFHSVNAPITDYIARAMELPLITGYTEGKKEKELMDLLRLIQLLKVDGIVVGGIASVYQKERFKKICEQAGLEMVAPLWDMEPEEIIRTVIDNFEVIIVRVAAMGLDESWLGRKLDENTLIDLMELNRRYGVHLAGEGGEYETLVLDAPLYKRKLKILEAETRYGGMAGDLIVKKIELVEK